MFNFKSLQGKIGGVLTVILLLAIGCSVGFTTLQARSLLKKQQQSALDAAHTAALAQARSIFQSLQLGTSGSLERGDMDAFKELLQGLASIPDVSEVGLAGPTGQILFSSNPDKIKTQLDKLKTLPNSSAETQEQETGQDIVMAHGHSFEQRCLECHDGAKVGELAGILYVDYSLESLIHEQQRQAVFLADASRRSLVSGLGTGTFGLVAAWLALFFMVSKLIVRPLARVRNLLGEIGRGHLKSRLNLDQQDEIGETARSLDELAASLNSEVVDNLQKLANGDLTFQVAPRDSQDLLRGALQKLGTDLNGIMQNLHIAGEQIASGAAQVADASQSLSQGATEQASSLEEISASLHEMTSQVKQNAENASQANHLSSEAQRAAETGNRHMQQMVEAMGKINLSAQNISKIIKVIDEIAFQTNLLALNAAVEAARTGQHGKGFAVVAEEVRNLAARSAKAARETAELIEGSVTITEQGGQIADQTAAALGEIVSGVTKVADLVAEIAAASNEQAQGIAQVSQGLGQIDQVTQQNTASAEESAAASEELSGQASQLRSMLARFSLKQSGGSPRSVPPPVSKPPAEPAPRATSTMSKAAPGRAGWDNMKSAEPSSIIALDDSEFGKY